MRYDVVVVGAGSAGAVLANRLTKDPRRTVLLVEAGPDHNAAHTPAGIASGSLFEAISEPGRIYDDLLVQHTPGGALKLYPRGRGVGGSSAVNAMVGMWGVPDDYDHWERDLGCEGWNWASMSAMLARIQVPLAPTPESEWGDVDRALVTAARQLGHSDCQDPRGKDLGVGPSWLTRANGQRVSVNDSYLEKARDRTNLEIRANEVVDRVLVDGRRAVGVELVDGTVIEAGLVIICAGAIHSPAILLRSAIDLAGIGQGLKDHASITLTLALREPAGPGLDSATMLRWSSHGGDADLQVLPLNRLGTADLLQSYGGLMAALMDVQSSGQLRLESMNPMVHPAVEFNHLGLPRDRDRLREAVRHGAVLAETSAFQEIASNVFIDAVGTPVSALAEDDDAFDEWMVANIGNYVHASSSCRMGPRDDPMAVVDDRCFVHGYQDLMVCDASVFADLPRANTHIPALMVAERISEILLDGRDV